MDNHKRKLEEEYDNLISTIKKNVTDEIKQRNLSLKDFAKQNDWYYTDFYKTICIRDTISFRNIVRLSIALNINVTELLQGKKNEKKI